MGEDEVSEEYLLQIRREKTSRELDRIRNSFSFRSGQIIAKSLRFPLLLLILPFWLFGFTFMYGLERLGKKSAHTVISDRRIIDPKRCIVFFPTNGVGLGHFTRLLAVAKRIREKDPEVEIIFVTTMAALHLLETKGIPSYHLPGAYMFKDMSSSEWNAITEEMLATVFEIHRPSVFVFDGAFPYRGMLNAIKNRHGLKNIWLRRGAFKKGGTKIPIDSIQHFHKVIRPGDSVEFQTQEIDLAIPIEHVNPILLADKSELMERSLVRTRFGVPQDAILVYIQLGAGKINEIENDLEKVIRILNENKKIYIVVGESIIGDRLEIQGDRLTIIRDYPNSMFFQGFDFAVMAGGYNSYHEAIAFELPTLFIPNSNTGMDDQSSRVLAGKQKRACLSLMEKSEESIRLSIDALMQNNIREDMRSACAKLHQENGAEQVASSLLNLLE